MEQSESQSQLELESTEVESFRDRLQEVIKPYQQEQNQRQRKSDFLTKCIRCLEKNDFFQLEELLRSKQANEVLEDSSFKSCGSLFNQLLNYAEMQVDSHRVKIKETLLQLAEEAALPLEVDFPRFFVLKGIEGRLDFSTRSTVINQMTLKSMDPKRIISTAVKLKRSLYDSPFEPQAFIDGLLRCYQEILRKEGRGANDAVSIQQLYTDYVLSLQNKTFFLNMDKGKFKGYSLEQFSVDLWRYFKSNVSAAEGGFRIKLNSGRGKSFLLIDHDGEKRQITQAQFIKN